MTSFLRRRPLVLVLALAGVATGCLFWIPQEEGPPPEVRTTVDAPVRVQFDAAGVVHVFASTRADAAFAIGFMHAQKRPMQMQYAKRAPHGRLSEVAGLATLGQDTLLRRLRLTEAAATQFQRLPVTEQALLRAYARGVNAGSARTAPGVRAALVQHELPPLQWEPEDAVAWSLYMAFLMAGNWRSELDRLLLSGKLLAQDVQLLLPSTASDDTALPAGQPLAAESLVSLEGAETFVQQESMGSNAWVVPADRSRSGKPMLANDPHLPLTVPSPWFLARIAVQGDDPAERQDVIGATSPGLPMVLIGRTEQVAWGLTRSGADTQHLYLEESHPDNDHQYRVEDRWSELFQRVETIGVRGQPAATVRVEASRHGPIVGEVRPSHPESGVEVRQRIALRWEALQDFAGSVSAAFASNRATGCADLLRAFGSHTAPAQNVLAADAAGGVCIALAGRIPQRQGGTDSMPSPGWTADGSGPAWLPADRMPAVVDASVNSRMPLANANQAWSSPGATAVTGEWDRPYRHSRILDLLEQQPLHDLSSFRAIQYDSLSLEAVRLLPALMRTRAADAPAHRALALLQGFDGDMRADSGAPLVYTAWLDEFTSTVLGRRLGPMQFGELYGRRLFRPALERLLLDPLTASRWCQSPDCGPELAEALSKAAARLTQAQGADTRGWRWGRAHAVEPIAAGFGLRGSNAQPALEVGGDHSTVSMTHFEIRGMGSYPTRLGPNTRLVYDLADRNSSWFVQFGGPDESTTSANMQAGLDWQQGRYSELRFEPRRWLGGLRLLPQQ